MKLPHSIICVCGGGGGGRRGRREEGGWYSMSTCEYIIIMVTDSNFSPISSTTSFGRTFKERMNSLNASPLLKAPVV